MEKKHNGEIAVWKFIYCLMIIALHFFVSAKYNGKLNFAGGSIGVEFFFIVSGYLLGKKALTNIKYENLGIETYEFMKNRIKKMFPMISLVLLISLVVFLLTKKYANYQIVNFVWDFIFCRNLGIKYSTLMYVGWYTSVLMGSSLILYPLALKFKNTFAYIIGPLIIIFVGGYIAYKYGNLCWDGEYYTKCFLRVFFEMTIGICLYEFSNKIKEINWTTFGKIALTVIEYACFASILFLVNKEDFHNKYDFVSLLIISIGILIAFSEKSILTNIFKNKFFFYLEKLSLPMFLSQVLIIYIFMNYYEKMQMNPFIGLLIVVIMDIVFSMLCIMVVKIYGRFEHKIKGLFIKETKNGK